MEYLPIIIAVLVVLFILANMKIVPQAHEYVIEFLGKYKTTWSAGFHVLIPFFERIAKKITLKEQVLDSPPQPVITKDNVTMQIDTVVYFKVFDSKLYTYGAVNPISALENLAATRPINGVSRSAALSSRTSSRLRKFRWRWRSR